MLFILILCVRIAGAFSRITTLKFCRLLSNTTAQLSAQIMKGLRPYETKTGLYNKSLLIPFFFKFFIWGINIFSFFLLTLKTSAQTCTTLGDPVVNQTFGTKGYQLPLNSTSYQFVGGCPNSKGTYTLSGFLFGCGPRSWVQMVGDHTIGDSEGNYMLVNGESTPGIVYTDTARNLCGNTVYQFGMWATPVMTSFACSGSAVLPNVKYTLKTISGTILAEDSTGNLPIVNDREWKYYGLSITTPASVTDVIVLITINPPFGCGSAFAIDDVTLSPCSPSLITASLNGGAGPVEVCADYTDVWMLNGNYTPGFVNPVYQWQSSIDFGATWVDIPGETTLNYLAPHRISGTIFYRICIAESGNINSINCRITSNSIRTGVHPLPSPVPPVNVRGCIGKDFYFPPSDPSALQVLWTGPNGYSSTNAIATIPNVQYSDTGLYRVKETFYFGCVLYDTFYLKVFPGTSVNVQPATPLCEGQSETLSATATDIVQFKWTPSTGLSNNAIANPVASPHDSTVYKVVTTNEYGCQDSAYVTIDVYRNPLANAGSDKFIMLGDTAILNGSFTGTSINFNWTPPTTITNTNILNPQVFPAQTSVYTLNAVSALGCGTHSDQVKVNVLNDLYIPNAFTPNNDGLNDQFKIMSFANYKIINFEIFNRWGEIVYRATDNFGSWDGTYKKLPQPTGIYAFQVDIIGPNNTKIFRKGTVTLIR